ncbi:hypothetical protein [Sphingomonas japonica]|uniref:TniQ protein n=1 Tax=Sphingomonas japonica TaxID=511662 RepID=A0ABX0TYU3_9SPHN|nr:hypothetical protein [Sphingomonas japonica]NIJ22489.1 hypothetical protein [Sphingomonas japonica]
MSALDLPQVRWPIVPVGGESLPSLLVRTAEENGHPDMGTILSFARLGTWNGIGITMRQEQSRAALAHVIDQPQAVVDERAHALTEPIAGMDTIDFFGARVLASDVLYDRRRMGSTAGNGVHHKAVWQMIHLPVDVDDGALIVDRCQSCGTRLGWRTITSTSQCAVYRTSGADHDRTAFVSAGYDCREPGAGVNDQPRIIDGNRLDRVSLLGKLIDPRPEVHGPVRAALHPDLRAQDRGIVFYLGLKLGRAVGLGGTGSRLRRGLAAPLDEAITALEIGSEIIAGWPDSVARLVAEKTGEDHELAMAAIAAVRRVCHGESAWPDHRALVTAAMPDIVNGHYQHVIRRIAPGIVDGKEASRIIGIRGSSMVRLIRAKAIVPRITRGTARTHGSFLLSDVEAIADAVKDSVEATQIVDETGITLHGVEQLICDGQLAHADSAAVLALFPNLRVTRASYEALLARIRAVSNDDAGPGDRLTLRLAVQRIGGREKPWAAIIAALVDGRLPFCIGGAPGRLIDRIWVAPGPAIDEVLANVFDRADHAARFTFATVMRQRDAIELLNIDPSRYQDIAKLLPPEVHGPHKTLVVSEILKVAARIIDGREAKHRWGARLDRRRMIDDGVGWLRVETEADFAKTRQPNQERFEF